MDLTSFIFWSGVYVGVLHALVRVGMCICVLYVLLGVGLVCTS